MNKSEIKYGSFYFIKDDYFADFPDPQLMSNKESVAGKKHDRACFYALEDAENDIYWFIPISSQVDKFQRIYEKKKEKHKEVDTIVFGYVLGNKRAFLIQNMFPVQARYVKNEYIDPVTGDPVAINEKLRKELDRKCKKVLNLQRKGFNLIFPDVLMIERKLIESNVYSHVAPTIENKSD